MNPTQAPTRRKEARQPEAGSAPMRRYTLFSLGIHILILSSLSLPWSRREKPILADPIYEVALIKWPEPNFEPPKPAAKPTPKPPEPKPPEPKPKPKPKLETVPLKETKAAPKEKPKPEVKPVETTPVKEVPTDAENPVSVGVDQPDFKQDSYLNTLRRILARAWEPPGGGDGITQASVHLVIKKDGTVVDPEVRSSSGWSLYDRSTLRAVLTVKKFPPLPESYSGNELGLTVNFRQNVETAP
jgi:TonB family protein